MPERFGLYYAPPVSSELWRRAAIWLGRDATNRFDLEADVGGLDPERRHAVTQAARRYGFHATLKAPMELDAKLEGKDLDRALKAWTGQQSPVPIGRLQLAELGGFLALLPVAQSPALTDFAAAVVVDFDDFRAPLGAADRERRHENLRLSDHQAALLERFGYPYVLDQFLFHMTLSDQLPADELAPVRAAAEAWFAPVLGEELLLDRVVLFREAEPGTPFLRLRDYPLTGEPG
jgi:putative phosphonate metabolism protein